MLRFFLSSVVKIVDCVVAELVAVSVLSFWVIEAFKLGTWGSNVLCILASLTSFMLLFSFSFTYCWTVLYKLYISVMAQ